MPSNNIKSKKTPAFSTRALIKKARWPKETESTSDMQTIGKVCPITHMNPTPHPTLLGLLIRC